ncbi:hypothetical protein LPB140_04010 [Sphingorhabdus lutea]|uniref:Uncharacterized protein n=1 Tax=Sphingorhabdus lutea TaxID=1913578 RepID=A0A1L3JAG1_9SPHN|nr:polysaccharide biosynthesis C-terminal domain-containing protein [Sphingorhabdus lutea]APG62111.1 hypothetical protein LPB140_04010 [Sphingorhabdus lutea]
MTQAQGANSGAINGEPAKVIDRSDVAKGAGMAALSRLGVVVEVLAQPAYTWMFGLTGYGIYVVLWAAVNIIARFLDFAMGQVLQRLVPATNDKVRAHAIVKFALLFATLMGAIAALIISLSADYVATHISSTPEQAKNMPRAIAIFAWTIPLSIFMEVATASARAMRAFGPELRLRVFWEQVARLIFAAGFFLIGFGFEGLLWAHVVSLSLIAILCVQLLGKYFDIKLLISAPVSDVWREIIHTGLAMMPSNLVRRAHNDLPPILLNFLIPGAAGATAAGLFGIARKIASIPLIVRQTFLYVLAPIASSVAAGNRRDIAPIYSFANHISLVISVPLALFLMMVAGDILTAFAPGAKAALTILLILLAARAIEAVFGPATPIIEMIGHKALPLINSAVGLILWLVFAILWVPQYGLEGMAMAVAIPVVIMTLMAVFELWQSDGISPFDSGFARGLIVTAIVCAILWGIGFLLQPFGGRIRAITLFILFWPSVWLCLRFGLDNHAKEALGKAAKKLRLI